MRDMDDLINERIVWVDDELRAMLPAAKDEPIVYGMLRYHLGWTDPAGVSVGPAEARRYGGKRLRGVTKLFDLDGRASLESKIVAAVLALGAKSVRGWSAAEESLTRGIEPLAGHPPTTRFLAGAA